MEVRTCTERDWLEFVADLLVGPLTALPAEPIAQQLIRTFNLAGCSFDDRAPGAGAQRIRSDHHQLLIPLQTDRPHRRAFALERSYPFGPGEVELARLLQRLLIGLDRQARAFARRRNRTDVEAAAVATDIRLTPREIAVLSAMTDGLTACAAGHRLGIAERTVHKHLERAYAKLGVTDRVSAVLRAQRLGLLAP